MKTGYCFIISMFILALVAPAFGQDEKPKSEAPSGSKFDVSRTVFPFLLGSEDDLDFAGKVLGLTGEEKELLAEQVKTVKTKCAKSITKGKNILSKEEIEVKGKISRICRFKEDETCLKVLRKATAKLRNTLPAGKYQTLSLWSRERLELLAGEKVSPAESGKAIANAIASELGIPEKEAQKFHQPWIYYKTIELTHRERIVQKQDDSGTDQVNYIRMTRTQTDSRTRQFLPEEKRSEYNKYMGLE